jgi:positive regulator of sigma E activity
MQIIDYIFYRLYLTYKKANEGPVFSTVFVFLSFFMLYVGFAIAIVGTYLFNNNNAFIVVLIIVSIFGLILIMRRYNKKKSKIFS